MQIFPPYKKHTYGSRRPVTGLALLFYIYRMFVPHRKQTYGPLRPLTGIAFLVRH
jgi:hypothetical protein